MLAVGSLFAGIGGFDLGLERAGMKVKWQAEVEPFPSAVLRHHWPGVSNLGDVTAADFLDRAEPVDVICGGSPCQAFSVAGLGKSLDDDRGKLTLRFVEICLALRPTWIVWENVPGVLGKKDNPFGCLLGGLAGANTPLVPPGGKWPGHGLVLGQEYRLAWTIKDAQYFGVPQQRRRVFLVGSLGDWACAEALFPVRQGMQGHPAPGRQAGKEIAGTLGGSSQSGGFRTTDLDNSGALIPTVAFNWANGGGYGKANEGLGIRIEKSPPHSCSQVAAVAFKPSYYTRGKDGAPSKLSPPLSAEADKGDQDPLVLVFETRYVRNGRGAPSSTVPPLKALSGGTGKGDAAPCICFDTTQITSDKNYSNPKPGGPCHPLAAGTHAPAIASTMAVRRLTPLECSRLQGFPDDWLLVIKWKGNKPPKDSPMYKALGNAVNKKVAEWLGQRIREAAA